MHWHSGLRDNAVAALQRSDERREWARAGAGKKFNNTAMLFSPVTQHMALAQVHSLHVKGELRICQACSRTPGSSTALGDRADTATRAAWRMKSCDGDGRAAVWEEGEDATSGAETCSQPRSAEQRRLVKPFLRAAMVLFDRNAFECMFT